MALVFKVGALVLRGLAKPLADRFQLWALAHPTTRGYIINTAQWMHRVEVSITRYAEGKRDNVFVGAMTEEKSLELASKLASEAFIFAFGFLIIAAEFERHRRSDVDKKAVADDERTQLLRHAEEERLRLVGENLEKQALIGRLMTRVDLVEQQLFSAHLQLQAQQRKQERTWGGFFGPSGLT